MKEARGQLKAIDRIYAGLPTLTCKGKCQECCGPIAMSRAEWDRIVVRLGFEPRGDPSLVCPMLCRSSGRCTVYDIRPIICRLWGMVRAMACPHGCTPSRWLTDVEAARLIAKVQGIGNEVYRGGVRP